MTVVIDSDFDPVPSLARHIDIVVSRDAGQANAVATFVAAGATGAASSVTDVDDWGEIGSDQLASAGFTGATGQQLVIPGRLMRVLVGIGDGIRTVAQLRDAAAAAARAASECAVLALDVSTVIGAGEVDTQLIGQAVVEGVVLARYRYDALKRNSKTVQLKRLILVTADAAGSEAEEVVALAHDQLRLGAARGLVRARSSMLARDLGNTPPRHLNAEKFARVIEELAPGFGLTAQVYDRQQLVALGCGGVLGVNAGSTEEPRVIKITYLPEVVTERTPHLALVGKGIMYDSGGISLKPSNAMHAVMKLDMMGAAAVFASMTALRELDVQTGVTGWLMCTDNMPSGSATKLGDVLSIRGGTTVEVKNTDAEGRLVLADGLVLASEDARLPDAVVDIATLTGAALMALGTRTAAMFANNDELAAQLQTAADVSDETIWRLPLDHRYRDQLKSEVADLSNIGGQYAGAILAALFLNEFVDDLPWAHLDIAGTMQAEQDDLWRVTGSTGFGARLLIEFAAAFAQPAGGGRDLDESVA